MYLHSDNVYTSFIVSWDVKTNENLNSIKRRCEICYPDKKFGSQSWQKIAHILWQLSDKPHLCLPCFNNKFDRSDVFVISISKLLLLLLLFDICRNVRVNDESAKQ